MLLIVDDEPRQRRFLVNTIRELRPDYSVEEARNGREALQMIASHPITAIITDIHMPLLDGLTFVDECKKINEQIMVVFLSAYTNFDYAQKALRLGAVDYVVKPLNKAKLNEILEKLEHMEAERRAQKELQNRLKKQLDTALPVYQENLLRKFLQGNTSADTLGEIAALLNRAPYHLVLVFRPDLESQLPAALDGEDLKEICSNIRLRLNEQFSPACGCLFCPAEGGESSFAAVLMEDTPIDPDDTVFTAQMNLLLQEINLDYGINWSVAGAACRGMPDREAPWAYTQALKKLDAAFFEGFGHYYGEPVQENGTGPSHNHTDEKLLAEAVASMDLTRAHEILSKIFQQLEDTNCSPTEYKTYLWYVFLYVCKQNQLALDTNYFLTMNERVKSRLLDCQTKVATQAAATAMLEQLLLEIESRTQAASEEALIASRQYINAHYMDDLSRDDVAARFHFSSSYFSLVFKRTFGVAFSEYLTEVRMESAVHLLENGRGSLVTIAREVGYNDVKYFLRVFKKYFKCTPLEYRHKGG